jgi:hypothetical protein
MRVMVVMAVMMLRGGERRANKHHQKQCSGKNLLHGLNVARKREKEQWKYWSAPREERGEERAGIGRRPA